MVRLESVLNSWKAVREDSAQAVQDFSAHDLAYKPNADLMSFGEIARHILEAGHILTGFLLDGVDNMAAPEARGAHRSQLFLYLRLKGIVPPATRRRMAKTNAS